MRHFYTRYKENNMNHHSGNIFIEQTKSFKKANSII